jgi:hypothetical protein
MKRFAAEGSWVENPRPFLRIELESTSETGCSWGKIERPAYVIRSERHFDRH